MHSNNENKRILRLLFWESTIKCNLTCAHCRRVEDDDAAGSDLSTEQAKVLIDQLAVIGVEQGFMPILVFSGGEPMCREDIFELIQYAADKEIKCALATNGTLITDELAAKVKSVGVQRVSVSLDGATSEIHNKLRKLEGSFEAAVAGINSLRECGVPFQVNMTVTRYNRHQLDDLFVLAKDLGAVAVHLFMLVPVGCGQEFADGDMLSPEEYEQVLISTAKRSASESLEIKVTCGPHYERVVRQEKIVPGKPQGHPGGHPPMDAMKGKPAGHPHGKKTKGCLAGSGVIFVGHDGDVFPCGYLPVNCGNVVESSLGEIWTGSEDLAKMRDIKGLKGKCGICEYKGVCGGCRARAFAATGDYMEEEPTCNYVPPSK